MLLDEPIRKILLYVDGSEECITASQYSIALAKKTGAELIALYVVNISLMENVISTTFPSLLVQREWKLKAN